MNEYTLLGSNDVRTMLRLLNELHDVSGRGETWKRRLLDTVCPLVEAAAGLCCIRAGAVNCGASTAELGLGRVRRDEILQCLSNGTLRTLFSAANRCNDQRATVLDHELSRPLCSRLQSSGPGRFIVSLHKLPESHWGLLLLTNPPDAPRFTPRQGEIVHLLHSELDSLYAPEIRRAEPPSNGQALAPRLQQTLDLLLSGASEKEVAKRLLLSPHTVHVYVRSLYRRYQVNRRSQLLSRVLTQCQATR